MESTYRNQPVNFYWQQLRDLPAEKKVRLITLLSSSLANSVKDTPSFPKIPKDFKPSEKILALSLGEPSEPFDFEKETEEMWEELAR